MSGCYATTGLSGRSCGREFWAVMACGRTIKFLLDTGADRTVISASVLEALNLQGVQPKDRIGGVGGLAESVDVTTQIRLVRDDGQWVTLRGTYAACLEQRNIGHQRAWPRHFESFCGHRRPCGGSRDAAPWRRSLFDSAPRVNGVKPARLASGNPTGEAPSGSGGSLGSYVPRIPGEPVKSVNHPARNGHGQPRACRPHPYPPE